MTIRTHSKIKPWTCALALSCLTVACEDGDDPRDEDQSTETEEEGTDENCTGDTEDDSSTGDDEQEDSTTTAAEESAETDSSGLPEGCTDNASNFFAAVIDTDIIRLSSLDFACTEDVDIDLDDIDCTFDDYDARLVIPNLEPGSYELADGVVSMTMAREWDHDQSQDGCFCVDSFTAGDAITSGSVTIETYEGEGYAYSVELSGLDHPLFSGELSFLVPLGECE
ncbi:hypothetical protein G6O69_35630 [Pseudenhygromyxa sp. WMMC2535]|uniref:hypothetical protein n=1 Tax=Pseudenhygromyxa sp. WMMC2535 TaxID=2712867 RepID=UPI001553E9BA|nr:hypothetical protein [Pseudenhygromyxa sp. WMMC2535]NVB43210.1 hypothetical protein [Pseudenhygromyxa sp. WMMC2535]